MGPSMTLETLASQITVCRPVDKAFVEACQKHGEHAGKHCLAIMTPAVASGGVLRNVPISTQVTEGALA